MSSAVLDTSAPRPEAERTAAGRAGTAGVLAALVMLTLPLAWRLTLSPPGVPSFPEMVVAAVARLTPLALFGWATENFGPLAKNTLFVLTLLGTLAVGRWAGSTAWRWAASGRFGSGGGATLKAGLAMAGALLAVALLVVAPIARLGFLAAASEATGQILLQLVVSFAVFGVAWAWLFEALAPSPATAEVDSAAAAEAGTTRRGVLGAAAVGLGAAVAGMAWKLFQPTQTIDRAASEEAARAIAATAEARSAAAAASPTAPPAVAATAGTPAAQVAAADAAEFAKLEAAGQLTPRLTATADFYHVSKNISDPVVPLQGWALSVGGMVEKPTVFQYDDLVKRATTKNITTLCCISNDLNGDLISTAEWTGVPLKELLADAVPQSGVVDLKLSAADGYEESFPIAIAQDPAVLLVVGMNGQPLPSDHGFPARLIVPPIYGMKNVKWLQKIEAVGEDFQGYWEERGWSDYAHYQIWGRFDTPGLGEEVKAGSVTVAGLASAGDRGIQRVEVSLDDGKTWADAVLEPSLNPPFTWVRWLYQFDAQPGVYKGVMRATDGTGKVMQSTIRSPLPDGATGWPTRDVRVVL